MEFLIAVAKKIVRLNVRLYEKILLIDSTASTISAAEFSFRLDFSGHLSD